MAGPQAQPPHPSSVVCFIHFGFARTEERSSAAEPARSNKEGNPSACHKYHCLSTQGKATQPASLTYKAHKAATVAVDWKRERAEPRRGWERQESSQ